MNNKNTDLTLLKFMLRAQQVARQARSSDKGYAMMMTSILSILTFSMLGAYLTMSNLSKSSTNAYVDGNNTFYAAESGLNKRAQELRQKFVDYATPSGTSPGSTTSVVTAANISNCFPLGTSTTATNNDFECRNYPFRYTNNKATIASSNNGSGGMGGGSQITENSNYVNYAAYTFVADKTTYSTTTTNAPVPQRIPVGEIYAGLNSQEYKYTVYATAAKVNSNQTTPTDVEKTVLQMDFKSRVIPLFQFAAFYDRDLEMNSTSQMTLNGWVHTNANLFVQPTPTATTNPGTYFYNNVTAAGDIYNRVDASTNTRTGAARVLMTGTTCSVTSTNCLSLPAYNSTRTTSITAAEMAPFNGKVANGGTGAAVLKTPDAGFLRKRNYYSNKIGEYFGKADLRLDFTPDRDVQFNFTAIQNGANATGGTCATTYTAGSDPALNYIDPERSGSNFKCTVLNEGQLQSLQQPVLVYQYNVAESTNRFCRQAATGVTDRIRQIINYDGVTANSIVAGMVPARQLKVFRALQVAIAASRDEIDYANVTNTGTLPTAVQDTFGTLLADSTLNIGLSTANIDALKVAPPATLAKAIGTCFLPAPVQIVRNAAGNDSFIDRRENRRLNMVQVNLESLTIWNRDGRYVNFDDNLLDGTDAATTTALNQSLRNDYNAMFGTFIGTDAYSTNGLLFVRKVADTAQAIGSFERLGLATADVTEGGLVFHATVNDDLDGDGTIDAPTEVVKDTTKPIYRLNPNGSLFRDSNNNTVIMDYLRLYAGGSSKQSPFGFAINGGRNLPGSLTFVTDQALYVQGDYNNYQDTQTTPVSAKKSASLLADTISVLSVNCISRGTTVDPTQVVTAQVNCGIPSTVTGSAPWTGTTIGVGGVGAMYDALPTTVNAAFLSYTDQSTGNLPGLGPKKYSGGLNNYMRMIEDWGGYNFNYTGSFISLGYPLEFSGSYVAGGMSTSYYNVPNRNFAYDTDFNSFDKLPPLTPRAIYLQQKSFKRTYN